MTYVIPHTYKAPSAPVTLRPMSAGMWIKLTSTWAHLNLTGQAGPYLPPPNGPDFRLGHHYVRLLGVSPKGRHVHYEVLRPRRRKNQAPDRHWMPVKQFLREATVCGFFKRVPDGSLEWVEPKEAVHGHGE